eukprot:scaffold41270_cov71-Phaeocystis_antarctica.AAC.1
MIAGSKSQRRQVQPAALQDNPRHPATRMHTRLNDVLVQLHRTLSSDPMGSLHSDSDLLARCAVGADLARKVHRARSV